MWVWWESRSSVAFTMVVLRPLMCTIYLECVLDDRRSKLNSDIVESKKGYQYIMFIYIRVAVPVPQLGTLFSHYVASTPAG